jgi:nicotinamidase-related amidase
MKLNAKKTALLTLDLQRGIFAMAPESERVIPQATKALELARTNQLLVIHVGLGFSEGHPEVPDFESPLLRAKQHNLFVKGSPSAEFHGAIFKPGDLVIHKQRVGAFSENHLELVLRARGIDHLVLFGISTSGIVLSTVRAAFDKDFRTVVLADACFDADAEVHRVLTEKVFPRQATVTSVDAFVDEQGR